MTEDEQAVLDAMARNIARVVRIEVLEGVLREALPQLERRLRDDEMNAQRINMSLDGSLKALCTKIRALLGEE